MDYIFDDETLEIGAEVEAFCTRCKADTPHNVVTKYEEEIRSVLCTTCNSTHAYRPPRGDAEEEIPEPIAVRRRQTTQKMTWEAAIQELDTNSACVYWPRETYQEGQVLDHPRFGLGFVAEVISDTKLEAVFEDGERLLVHNRTDLNIPRPKQRPGRAKQLMAQQFMARQLMAQQPKAQQLKAKTPASKRNTKSTAARVDQKGPAVKAAPFPGRGAAKKRPATSKRPAAGETPRSVAKLAPVKKASAVKEPVAVETPGTTKKSAGTTKKSAGTTKKSAGTTKKSAGTTKKSAGTTKKSAGTTKKSAGTTKKGTTKKSVGTTKKSAGTTKKAAVKGSPSAKKKAVPSAKKKVVASAKKKAIKKPASSAHGSKKKAGTSAQQRKKARS